MRESTRDDQRLGRTRRFRRHRSGCGRDAWLYPDGLASSTVGDGDVGAAVGAGDLRQRPYLLQRLGQLIRVFGKREGWSRGVTEIVAVEDDEDVGGPAVAEEFTERLLAATSAGESRQHQASRARPITRINPHVARHPERSWTRDLIQRERTSVIVAPAHVHVMQGTSPSLGGGCYTITLSGSGGDGASRNSSSTN